MNYGLGIGLGTIKAGLGITRKGTRQGKTQGDVWQQGGEALFAKGGQLLWYHANKNAEEHTNRLNCYCYRPIQRTVALILLSNYTQFRFSIKAQCTIKSNRQYVTNMWYPIYRLNTCTTWLIIYQ